MNMARSSKKKNAPLIVIDEQAGLVFNNETDLFSHFANEIAALEHEYKDLRKRDDVAESEFKKFEDNLEILLDDPDEVWEDTQTATGQSIFIYIRRFETEKEDIYHVAACYLTQDTPSFVYLHFPTRDEDLVAAYRRNQQVFDRTRAEIPMGAIDGDALHEGDELATGLYNAMLMVRGDKDIPEDQFHHYEDLRELTLEGADEIWRSADSMGNVLVSFIKDVSDEDEELHYIVVTAEDAPSGSHALLFSFPTRDKSLADRYRHGENLQAEEVVQENSH